MSPLIPSDGQNDGFAHCSNGWIEPPGPWFTDLAKADMDRVVDLLRTGLTIREIADETGFSKSKMGRLKKQAEAEGLA